MQSADISNVIAGVSAAVAVGSAVAAGVSAWRSRTAKREAESRAKDATDAAKEAATAAQDVAADVRRIAAVHESQQTANESKQAQQVGFNWSPVMGGRNGWEVLNNSDSPVSKVQVSALNGSEIVVYRNDLDRVAEFKIPVINGGTISAMFRASKVEADEEEVEQLQLSFTDARDRRWVRIGTGSPQRAD